MSCNDTPLEQMVGAILTSPKYRAISRDLVRRLCAQELAKGAKPAVAIKATKAKLHQVAGAYIDRRSDYNRWLEELADARASGCEDRFREACARAMGCHASTRERLPYLAEMFACVLADVGPIRTVLDLACGLNPLAIPWMQLGPTTQYLAYDVYHDLVEFLNGFMRLAGVRGQAAVRDVLSVLPNEQADVAFVMKSMPCLERQDGSAPARILDELRATRLVVSYPARTLGGRNKGMAENYEARLMALVTERRFAVRRFRFPGEVVFLLSR